MSLCLFSSCGYFGDDPVEDSEVYKSEDLAGGCEIDTQELAKILEKDVEIQINCLEENLDKFAKYVKREDPNSITDKELSSFIRRFFSSHAALMVGSIRLMFDISGLVLSDNSSSLKTENIKPLFELLRIVNKKLYKLMTLFENFDQDQAGLELTSEAVKKELSELVVEMKRLIEFSSQDTSADLNLKSFIVSIKSQFDIDVINVELIDALLSFKKLFLGGEREILTQSEFLHFLEMVPDFGAIAFRFINADEKQFNNKSELYGLYDEQVKIIESFIYPHKRDEVIIYRKEIYSLVKSFIDEDGITITNDDKVFKITLSDMMEISDSLKKNILGKNMNSSEYTFQEVFNFIKVLDSGLGFLTVNEKYKDIVKDGIESKEWNNSKSAFIATVNRFKENMVQSWTNNKLFPDNMQPIAFINDVIELVVEEFEYKEIFSDVVGIGKVMLVGGNRYQLEKDQLIEVFFKLEGLSQIVFDFMNADEKNHNEQEIIKLRFQQLNILNEMIDDNLFLHVASIEELLDIGAKVLEDNAIVTYRSTVEEIKKRLLGGYKSTVTLKDLKSVLKYAIDFYGQRYFASISYDLYEKELSSKSKINSFTYDRTHNDFNLYNAVELKAYKKDFVDKVSKLRIYRFEEGYQYYGDEFVRTRFGLLEHYMIGFAFDVLGKVFGHTSENGSLEINLEELNELLFSFKPVLIEYGLWSAYPETFGRNTLLLSDLFQANSNGSVSLDAMEVSEYGTLALFAIKAADELIEKTMNYCEEYSMDDMTGFEPGCYRKNFFNVFLNEMGMSKYLPKFNQYIQESTDEEELEFLLAIEGFAKENSGEGVPQVRRDMVLLIGAILNIESTFLRYDSDQSNVLEINELENGFPVYEEAIINLAGLTEGQAKYAKTIFFYMIKEMKQPSRANLMFYHYNPFADKEISSGRLNIGALLYNMVVASSENKN